MIRGLLAPLLLGLLSLAACEQMSEGAELTQEATQLATTQVSNTLKFASSKLIDVLLSTALQGVDAYINDKAGNDRKKALSEGMVKIQGDLKASAERGRDMLSSLKNDLSNFNIALASKSTVALQNLPKKGHAAKVYLQSIARSGGLLDNAAPGHDVSLKGVEDSIKAKEVLDAAVSAGFFQDLKEQLKDTIEALPEQANKAVQDFIDTLSSPEAMYRMLVGAAKGQINKAVVNQVC